jgi:hypothetical protein
MMIDVTPAGRVLPVTVDVSVTARVAIQPGGSDHVA